MARASVAPQIAQRIMRHSDYRTTQKHYTILGLSDTSKAIDQLPKIGATERRAATGTCDVQPVPMEATEANSKHQQYPQQLRRETVQSSAASCFDGGAKTQSTGSGKTLQNKGKSGQMRPHAKGCEKAGERVRTVNIQLGRRTSQFVTDCQHKSCETETDTPANSPNSLLETVASDSDLQRISEAWKTLPDSLRTAVLAIIQSHTD